ncbi:MAG TPA: T9SS type A sorting domain-containing protein, partial [Bacteroidales bacterium]|nr:T9SS type A sorting domain-containing protein [Bacteroidales bacterium]
ATGDVNRSFVPGAKAAGSVLLFNEGELDLSSGREVEIPVYAVNGMNLGAISLVFDYPAGSMDITGVSTAYGESNLLWTAENGRLVISWFHVEGMDALPGSEVLSIRAIASAGSTPALRLADGSELASIYGEAIANAALSMPKLVLSGWGNDLAISSYPNPTQGLSTVSYSLGKAGKARIALYNALGQEVALLLDAYTEAGEYQLQVDAASLPSGVYTLKLESGDEHSAHRLVIGQ